VVLYLYGLQYSSTRSSEYVLFTVVYNTQFFYYYYSSTVTHPP
jgi:hypothetical protein